MIQGAATAVAGQSRRRPMQQPIHQPHDTLFQALASRSARAERLVRAILPPESAALLSRQPMRLLNRSFITRKLRAVEADLLLETEFADGAGVLIYVLAEHKSAPAADTPPQLLTYIAAIWEWLLREQRGGSPYAAVMPVVFYHGERRWTVERDLPAGLTARQRRTVATLPYTVYNLGEVPPERWPTGDPGLEAAFILFRRTWRRRLSPDEGRRVLRAVQALADSDLLFPAALRYFAERFDNPAEQVEEMLPAGESARRRLMPTIAEQYEARGEARGQARGEVLGEARGQARALLRLARGRFGAVPADAARRIESGTIADLDRWLDNLLRAERVEEIFTTG